MKISSNPNQLSMVSSSSSRPSTDLGKKILGAKSTTLRQSNKKLTECQLKAKARLKQSKTEWRKGGEGQKALDAGYKNNDGTPDVKAFKRRIPEKSAINAGYTRDDGTADLPAHNKCRAEKKARNAGYTNDDGTGDPRAYYRHWAEKARYANYKNDDSTDDVTACNRRIAEQKDI